MIEQTSKPVDEQGLPAEIWLRGAEAEAAFAPSEGFWCTAWRVQRGGAWLKVLDEPPSWTALRTRPTFYGNPLLFPFPYGLSDGGFTYRGKRHALRDGSEKRVQHGLVRDYAWTVDRTWEDAEGAHVQASYTYTPTADEQGLVQFPFPFRMTVTYSLKGRELLFRCQATNLGDEPMPLGLGIHPYFPVPFDPAGQPHDNIVRSDVGYIGQWAWPGGAFTWAPAEGFWDLRAGTRVDEMFASIPESRNAFLTLYVQRPDMALESHGLTWSLEDQRTGLAVEIESNADMRALGLFGPQASPVISPVISTCLPNAFNMDAQGQPAGTIELAPGETWQTWVLMRIRG